MDFVDGIIRKIRPELNHIYHEAPFMTPTGWDLGWFCREHALHLYCLSRLLRMNASVCLGDFILHRPGMTSHSCIGEDADHAWCWIDGSPVDISLSVKGIYDDIPDVQLVYDDRMDLCQPFLLAHVVHETDANF